MADVEPIKRLMANTPDRPHLICNRCGDKWYKHGWIRNKQMKEGVRCQKCGGMMGPPFDLYTYRIPVGTEGEFAKKRSGLGWIKFTTARELAFREYGEDKKLWLFAEGDLLYRFEAEKVIWERVEL